MDDRLRRLACGTRKRFLKFGLRRLFYSWPGQPLELFELKSNTRLPIGVVETFGAQFQGQSSDGSQICVRDTTSANLKPGDRGDGPLLWCEFEPSMCNRLHYARRGVLRMLPILPGDGWVLRFVCFSLLNLCLCVSEIKLGLNNPLKICRKHVAA